jgi:hypothetical protein
MTLESVGAELQPQSQPTLEIAKITRLLEENIQSEIDTFSMCFSDEEVKNKFISEIKDCYIRHGRVYAHAMHALQGDIDNQSTVFDITDDIKGQYVQGVRDILNKYSTQYFPGKGRYTA